MPTTFTVGAVLTAAQMNAVVLTPIAKSAAYTAVDGDLVKMSGGFAVTLPTATTQYRVGVIATDSNVANGVKSAGSAKIIGPGLGSGTAAGTLVPLGATNAFMILESDGTDWYIVAGAQDTGRVAPGLTNSWVSVIQPYYRVTGNVGRLYGVVRSGTGGTSAFTIPAGLRPVQQGDYPALTLTGAAICLITLTTSGTVSPSATDAGGITLDGITYTID